MKRLGVLISAIGWIMMFGIVSTDDFYTIELREYHTVDWRVVLIAVVLAGIGVGVYVLGDIWEGVNR